jgi:hypothetical protein
MAYIPANTTFSGDGNQGFQLGQNYGTVSNSFVLPAGQSHYERCLAGLMLLTPSLSSIEQPKTPPSPSSTVPFSRDPDFVDRPDILAWIHEKCERPAARAALVGLGGIGYVK